MVDLVIIRSMKHQEIAKKIISLKSADLQLRNNLIEEGELSDGYNTAMKNMHNSNAEILDEIIDTIGYPTIELVGIEASEAAWLVIQHAIEKPSFMIKCLKLLQQVSNNNSTYLTQVAYLQDRIAVFQGRLQLYGTQFDWDKQGELSPQDYDDIIKVNQRRKSIGLNTLQEQTKVIRRQAKMENQSPPSDYHKRKEEMDEWRKRVGWIEG